MAHSLEKTSSVSIAQRSFKILETVKDPQGRYEVLGKMGTVGWIIWKARNQKNFNDEEPNTYATII